MSGKVKPIPDGYPTLVPSLTIRGASEAIAYYAKVLGAKERMRVPGPGGLVMHAEIQIGTGVLFVNDETPQSTNKAPQAYGGSPVTVSVFVENVDEVFARATAAGAKVVRPLETQFYGDRTCVFQDPFGHHWYVSTHVEDVSPEEMQRRMASMMPSS